MVWNFDLTSIPKGQREPRTDAKGKEYTVFVPERIWAATPGGFVVLTQYLEPTKQCPNGRWLNMNSEHSPVAWQPFVKPEYPAGLRSDAGLDLVHRHSEINTPILEDVGSGP